jgi:hypothetical protein
MVAQKKAAAIVIPIIAQRNVGAMVPPTVAQKNTAVMVPPTVAQKNVEVMVPLKVPMVSQAEGTRKAAAVTSRRIKRLADIVAATLTVAMVGVKRATVSPRDAEAEMTKTKRMAWGGSMSTMTTTAVAAATAMEDIERARVAERGRRIKVLNCTSRTRIVLL